jgi:NTE family protein
VQWNVTTGADGLPDYHGNSQLGRVQYIFDNQDRALVPEYGLRATVDIGYLYGTPGSPSAPHSTARFEIAHQLSKKNVIFLNAEGGTMFNRDVAQPFRFTIGGPERLSASSIDQYRGTDYFLVTPAYLRKIKSLPSPLGSNLYVGSIFELGQMRAPDAANITRFDFSFGLVAETPLGVISIAPAFGNAGERKLVFTIGRLF